MYPVAPTRLIKNSDHRRTLRGKEVAAATVVIQPKLDLILAGLAVKVAHRLPKNTVREQWGNRPYLLLTQTAASNLGQPEIGTQHGEHYADVGAIDTRILLAHSKP
jgi:hypothetical protein